MAYVTKSLSYVCNPGSMSKEQEVVSIADAVGTLSRCNNWSLHRIMQSWRKHHPP